MAKKKRRSPAQRGTSTSRPKQKLTAVDTKTLRDITNLADTVVAPSIGTDAVRRLED